MTTKNDILDKLALISATATEISNEIPHPAGSTSELESSADNLELLVAALIDFVDENL